MRRVGKTGIAESRERQQNANVKRFGKVWNEGDIFRIFFPIAEDEEGNRGVMVGSCYGHQLDGKALGISKFYAPTTGEIVKGRLVKPDLLAKLARISRALFNAEMMSEQLNIAQDETLSEPERILQLNAIKDKWANKSPAIGPLRLTIMTEAVVVPFRSVVVPDSNGKEVTELRPDYERAAHVRIDLSDERINKISKMLLDNEAAYHDEHAILEIQQAFPKVGNRTQAGRDAAYTLVKAEDSLFTKFKDSENQISNFLSKLPEDGEILHNRTRDFEVVPIPMLVSTFSSFLKKTSVFIEAAAEEDKAILLANALTYRDLKVRFKNDALQEEFDKAAQTAAQEEAFAQLQEQQANALMTPEAPVAQQPAPAVQPTVAPAVQQPAPQAQVTPPAPQAPVASEVQPSLVEQPMPVAPEVQPSLEVRPEEAAAVSAVPVESVEHVRPEEVEALTTSPAPLPSEQPPTIGGLMGEEALPAQDEEEIDMSSLDD